MTVLDSEQVRGQLQAAPGAVVYLIGIAGCGMSGLGHLLLDAGHAVAGSDLVFNAEAGALRARGARVHVGHAAAHIEAAVPLLVAYSSAIRADHPELVWARERGIPCVRRAVLLAALMAGHRSVGVAGTHGKTTTAALLSFALEQMGAAPSYAVGASVPQLPRHARYRAPGSWFVAELDESDGSLCEFHPEFALVLNADEEHLDHFPDLEAVAREFRRFAGQVRERVVFCADDLELARRFADLPGAISFGYASHAAYRIVPASVAAEAAPRAERSAGCRQPVAMRGAPPGNGNSCDARELGEVVGDCGAARPAGAGAAGRFELRLGSQRLGPFAIQLVGEQNISNAAGVIALLHQLGWRPDELAAAIAPFTGAARRQHQLFADQRFRVFDDYGHHPREIRATLRALKGLGCRRLLVAFQPHRFTRTRLLLGQFASAFAEADRLWLTEVYAASEAPIPGVDGRALAAAVQAAQAGVEYVPSLTDLRSAVRRAMEPGDVVLFLGAGDITQAAHELARELRSESGSGPMGSSPGAALATGLSPETVVRRQEPMAKRTTLRVGGPADWYVEPASEADLAAVLRECAERALPLFFLGRGSNLLVKDGGIRGVVICLAHPRFCRIEVRGHGLHCGAGARLKAVAREAKQHGLSGLEFLEGIPGSVGGALRMNAGAMGGAVFQVADRVRFMDLGGQVHERAGHEIEVEYRRCRFFATHVALSAVLKGSPAAAEVIEQRMAAFSRKRWASQPAAPSAGCIFKNPPMLPAGKLIEELGLKGLRIGGATVSERHGNFFVTDGAATAKDVLDLIALVQCRVRAARGVDLQTEVEIVGEESQATLAAQEY